MTRLVLLAVCAFLSTLPACGLKPKAPMQGVVVPTPNAPGDLDAAPVQWPFAPRVMEIHPLTRVTKDPRGKPVLVAHIEIRDQWGDTTKAVGKLRLELYRVEGGLAGSAGRLTQELRTQLNTIRGDGPVTLGRISGRQEARWDVDLADLVMQRLYDPATRTYRLELDGIPDWLMADPANANDATAVLRGVLSTSGPKGEPQTLESLYAL